MNSLVLDKIKGLIECCSESKDFFSQYVKMSQCLLYSINTMDEDNKFGVIVRLEKEKKVLSVPLVLKSFLNVKTYLDLQTQQIPTSQGLFNVLSNFYGVNLVLSFIKEVRDDIYYTYLLTEKDNRFFCINIYFSDVVCISRSVDLPVYINKKIIKENGIVEKDIGNYLI